MNEQPNSQERIHLHLRTLVATALNQSELIGLAGMLRVIAQAVDAYGCILWEVAPDVDWEERPPRGRLFVVAEWFEGGKNFIRRELPLHSSANGEAILTGKVINISDPQHDPRVFHGNDFLGEAGIQAMCAIPIPFRQQVEGRVGKGAVALYRKDALPFTDLEIECAERLAALVPDLYQAVQDKFCQTLLREINDLLHEADGNAAKSPLPKVEVKEVLQKICMLLAERLRCTETAILMEDRFEAPGVFQELARVWSAADKSTKMDRYIGETGLADWVLTHARPVRIFDLAAANDDEQDLLQRDYPGLQLQNASELREALQEMLQLGPEANLPPLSVAAVPIVWGDELIGVLRYCITEEGPFFLADRELKLIEEIAQRISRFWRNWQLRREVEAENYSWQGLVESVCNLNDFAQRELTDHQPNENRIFTETLRVIENVVRGADATDIRLLDKQTKELYIAMSHGKAWNNGTSAERLARLSQRYPVSEEGLPTSASGHVYQTKEVYLIPDIHSNPYYSQSGPTAMLSTKRLILAPIFVGEHFYGVLDIRGTGNIEFPNYACGMAKLLGKQLGLYRHLAITIRDLIAAQTAMENQARVQTQVYQDLAHQLKSPITQAHARSQHALTGDIQDHAFQENLQSLRSLCSRAKRVTLSMSLFAALAQEQPINPILVPLTFNQLIKLLSEAATDHQLTVSPKRMLRFHVIEKSFEVLNDCEVGVDLDMLEQAVNNLLDNAAKYSYSNTQIRISGGLTKKGRFHITVLNRGLPVRSSEINQFTVRGWRSNEAKMASADGQGIGLWLVQHIMHAHEGELGISPTKPPGHNEFKLIFPAKVR